VQIAEAALQEWQLVDLRDADLRPAAHVHDRSVNRRVIEYDGLVLADALHGLDQQIASLAAKRARLKAQIDRELAAQQTDADHSAMQRSSGPMVRDDNEGDHERRSA
jgi:hypothetical protein